MNPRILAALLAGAASPAAPGSTLLWADNFNVANNTSLDASDITSDPAGLARRTGIAATGIQSRSSRVQHGILTNELNFLKPAADSGRVRFHVSGNGSTRFDFASGAVGPAIAAGGGVRVEFDWIAANDGSNNWIAFSAGVPASTTGEPGIRVNHAGTDSGILFRFNGGTQVFDNSAVVLTQAGASPAKIGVRHVVIDYAFSSFADGSAATMTASVDGHEVYRGPFNWDGNAGQLHFELETLEATRVDNLSFSTPPYTIAASTTVFKSAVGAGGLVATLSGLLGGAADASSYALVAGDGDTDNGKFQIAGDQLQGNGHDFTAAANGTTYRVRLRGTSSGATQTSDRVLVLTLFNDDDADNLLDNWELAKVANLTFLDGLLAGPGPGAGTGDFDADGLSDLQEYTISLGAYPNISPILADTDGDELNDAAEVNGTAGVRPATNPTLADTDNDGLSDLVETHTGTFASASDTGTNPIVADTDNDGANDGFEAANTPPFNPFVDNSLDDFDTDDLNTTQEAAAGTNPLDDDSDDDGLKDGPEINGTAGSRPATDPLLADSDDDGLSDLVETNTGTFTDATNTGTNPMAADGDGDGLNDGFEVENLDPYDPFVDDSMLDTDGDNLVTFEEVAAGTSVLLADTDGDDLDDGEELAGAGSRPATNPLLADSDIDGLSDKVETNTTVFVDADDTGTDPMVQDTDGDGARDGFEVARDSDPHDELVVPALPAGFLTQVITTDASSGISGSKTYTHKISGGGPATINGVVFEELNPALTPANFAWSTGTFAKNEINPINNGGWTPGNGGVVDPGLQGLFGGFTYSGNGDQPGSTQTYTLGGLTPGVTYDFRLYIRAWENAPSTPRPIDFTFTNGTQVEIPYGALMVDRPGTVLGTGNVDTAYYLSFTYTAQGSELVVQAKIPDGSPALSGSFHMYGMSNEVVPAPGGNLATTGVSRDGSGNLVIDFIGAPDTTYDVTRSPDLVTPFGPLVPPLAATTNGSGVGQAVVPAAEMSEPKEFYRIED